MVTVGSPKVWVAAEVAGKHTIRQLLVPAQNGLDLTVKLAGSIVLRRID